jgi:nucleotide-binding universal stress UspA family protein
MLLAKPPVVAASAYETFMKNRTPSKPVIPATAFDQDDDGSENWGSDTEEAIDDIRRAQKLKLRMTPVASYPDAQRCVRTLYRGDFALMQQEAEENIHRSRKFVVATDLSTEAEYALEWTIGTILRDGDTMLAVFCVDEEVGVVRPEDPTLAGKSSEQAHGRSASVAASTSRVPPRSSSIWGPRSPSLDRNQAEHQRIRAVDDITERVTKLLRKTQLQVRVVIEVISCKAPKQLIISIIDVLCPTMVILGSRGQSSIKGYVLFSILSPKSCTKPHV